MFVSTDGEFQEEQTNLRLIKTRPACRIGVWRGVAKHEDVGGDEWVIVFAKSVDTLSVGVVREDAYEWWGASMVGGAARASSRAKQRACSI
jgi:hypothetical protein